MIHHFFIIFAMCFVFNFIYANVIHSINEYDLLFFFYFYFQQFVTLFYDMKSLCRVRSSWQTCWLHATRDRFIWRILHQRDHDVLWLDIWHANIRNRSALAVLIEFLRFTITKSIGEKFERWTTTARFVCRRSHAWSGAVNFGWTNCWRWSIATTKYMESSCSHNQSWPKNCYHNNALHWRSTTSAYGMICGAFESPPSNYIDIYWLNNVWIIEFHFPFRLVWCARVAYWPKNHRITY